VTWSSCLKPFLCCLALLVATLVATGVRAGEPIPDIDVILEQNPGGIVKVDSRSGGFDEIELKVGKDFAKALSPVSLPAGWSLETEGKKARLSGPAVPGGQPVRLKLDAGNAPRPEKISYRVLLEGRTLLERKNVPAQIVPPRQVVGSLDGIVTMPTQVAPGEPMQLRVDDGANLPAGGTWTLSGTVTADAEDEDTAEAAPPEDRRRLALAVPPEHAAEVPAAVLADVATALGAQGSDAGTWEVVPVAPDDPALGAAKPPETGQIWLVARADTPQGAPQANQGRIVLDATQAVRNRTAPKGVARDRPETWVRGVPPPAPSRRSRPDHHLAVLGVRPVGTGSEDAPSLLVASLAIGPRGLGDGGHRPTDPPSELEDGCESPHQSATCCAGVGGAWLEDKDYGGFCFERLPVDTTMCLRPVELPPDPELCLEKLGGDTGSTFSVVEAGSEDGLHYFDLSGVPDTQGTTTFFATLSTSRSNLKKTSVAEADPDGTVNLLVPEGLQAGATLALQYADAFGDLALDVPEVPGVEVVEAGAGDQPRITDAMATSFAGQKACVCGLFPGPDAWNRILLDGEAVGKPLVASSRMAWVQLPAGLTPGEHVFTGDRDAGFPAEDRAPTLVLRVSGSLDANKLKRLETTPMRLRVEGVEQPIRLRVRNLTPAVISIEGGEDQEISTSGGTPNQLERTVRGLSPGAFNIRYEMTADACPCSGSSG